MKTCNCQECVSTRKASNGGRMVFTRKDHSCLNSGDLIEKGSHVESIKVFPKTRLSDELKISKIATVYLCGRCGECTH